MSEDYKQTLQDTLNSSVHLSKRHVHPRMLKMLELGGMNAVFTRGEGPYLYDAQGSRYLDFLSGGGVHFIGRNHPEPLSRWITRRIFPGAYPPTLAEAESGVLEPWRLSVLDVENLRPHYARTIDAWAERFEAARRRVVERYGERFARAWYLYLVGSRVGFEIGTLQLFQVLFARERESDVPQTRAGWYRDAPGAA